MQSKYYEQGQIMKREINYKTMRVVVGTIALLLAPAVHVFSGMEAELTSISISYWTDARDIFVGALIAVGFFLLAYNGEGGKADWEFYLSKAACLLAVFVALFPTSGYNELDRPPIWAVKSAGSIGLQTEHIHYGAAVLLFVCLIAMMWFFSHRALRKGKRGRAYFYRVIALSMAGGIFSLLGFGYLLDWNNTVLYIEIWELTLFGLGWLAAGTYKTEPSLESMPC
ncbi:hypothetical protein U876_10250 [Aeromonas hydrophila NJ-35]|nr:hypothetical protein V428_13210 [Aeromonas hydrophila subsp. hydrophila AL09-71]AHX69795.1 hypothetical protein V429_13230 [Aeromonas hydrophila pc104A]AJE38607.1 hypothetical protein V469_09875 [Aeromonas hydrophila J-1]AKJ37034.1 hypothetical protein U876_10250 [Aeromonas hydrophila NJ-35]ALQ63250.1 hypothetical protein AS145_10265 [Aeromonas hydrophila]